MNPLKAYLLLMALLVFAACGGEKKSQEQYQDILTKYENIDFEKQYMNASSLKTLADLFDVYKDELNDFKDNCDDVGQRASIKAIIGRFEVTEDKVNKLVDQIAGLPTRNPGSVSELLKQAAKYKRCWGTTMPLSVKKFAMEKWEEHIKNNSEKIWNLLTKDVAVKKKYTGPINDHMYYKHYGYHFIDYESSNVEAISPDRLKFDAKLQYQDDDRRKKMINVEGTFVLASNPDNIKVEFKSIR